MTLGITTKFGSFTMKKILTIGLMMAISVPALAQKSSDIKRLKSQKEKTLKILENSTVHFTQDMSSKFSCFPDYQMPFETLAANVQRNVDLATEATEVTFDLLINGVNNDGLQSKVEAIEKYKALKKKERNRHVRRSIKKIISEKKKQIKDLATLIVRDNEESYKQLLKDTITLGGLINLAMKENASNLSVVNIFKESESLTIADGRSISDIYNQELITLMDSCQTASCVYLVSGDVKQYLQDSMKLNKKIKLISSKAIKAHKAYKLKKIFKKLDEVANSIARRKPIGDITDDCMPAPAPAPVPGDDDTGSGDDGSVYDGSMNDGSIDNGGDDLPVDGEPTGDFLDEDDF